MKILLSNDDGYRAEGLTTLALALSDLAELVIVAPDRNQSGASHSLPLAWLWASSICNWDLSNW